MDESEKRTDFKMQGLSLIDVSLEDDCLINLSFVSPKNHPFSENQEQKSVRFLESFDASNGETPFNSCEERIEEFRPLESLEAEKTRKTEKYNLRKSLAWDKAFFTSEGVLEPEELSSMIRVEGTEKSEKHVLPGIQEDVNRSTDSSSTLESDTLTMKSLESDLFADIRASIQISSKVSNVANSKGNKKPGATESQTTRSSKVNLSSRDKMKPKASPKKPIVGTQGSGKAINQVSVRPQSSQSLATNGESTSSICKPPKVLGRVSPYSKISTKRASLGTNRLKMEKDNPKNSSVAVRGATASKTPSFSSSRNILPRPPTLASRSLHSSAANKKELTSSCSSFDSSGSASSDFSKLSMNSTKRRIGSGTCSPSSGSTVKFKSTIASKNKNRSGGSHPTACLRSVTKLSSSISPASSISEWSSGSPASNSTANQRPKNMRISLDSRSSSKEVSVDSDASQILDSPYNSNDESSVGDDAKVPRLHGACIKGASTSTGTAALRPPVKPSGLRMPSPKIGFFDGVRSSLHTPNGSKQSHPGLLNALPKTGAGSSSPSGGSIKAKLGKLQPARTATSMKSTKPRPSLPLQEPSNTATKVPNLSKNIKGALVSPKLQRRVSTSAKTGQVVCEGHEKSPPNFGLTEKNGSPNVLKDRLYSGSKGIAHVPGIKSSRMKEQLNASGNSDAENINPSQKDGGNFGQHIPKERSFEYEVGGVKDIHVVAEKIVTLPSPESILTQNS